MKLQGMKINFLGDSITSGNCTSSQAARYTNIIADKYGAEMRNYGISGSRISRNSRVSWVAQYDVDFCMRAPQMKKDADAVVVFGGTNDFGHGDAPFGTPMDKMPDTFCGAVNFLMNYLTKVYKDKPIIFMTPCQRKDRVHGDYSDHTLKQYVEAIKRAGKKFGVHVIDLYADDNIPDMTADGLHPNDEGHRYIAEILANYMLSI